MSRMTAEKAIRMTGSVVDFFWRGSGIGWFSFRAAFGEVYEDCHGEHGCGECDRTKRNSVLEPFAVWVRCEDEVRGAEAEREDADGCEDGDRFGNARFVAPGKFHYR